MNIIDKFSSENLFEKMNEIKPLPWNDFTYVNMLWLKNYGSRKVLASWEKSPITDIANLLTVMYATRWEILFSNVSKDILADGNKSNTTTKTITDNNNVSRETTNTSVHKVSAFDSEDFSDDNSDTENFTSQETANNDKKEVVESNGKNGNFTNDFIAFNSFLTDTKFFDMIIADINDVLTVKVLECDI